ncbi:MAG: nucleotidyltransferase [Caldicoprobacterales bacterium]|jgi:predicted nucleotidyltransferase
MRVLGIIAEYNPFHFGHLYHLRKSKELIKADYAVAVMSGQFTQRGEAAIADKWIRAETAVRCGVDLVLELPFVYAVQTAELFAYGGIQALNNTGLTTHVSFGSETGDLEPLQRIAAILLAEPEEYRMLLKSYLAKGFSYPAARYHGIMDYSKTSSEKLPDEVLKKALSGSNSILGIEYLKALKKTHSSITPLTIPRIRSAYSSQKIQKGISSATSIRREILADGMTGRVADALPGAVFDLLSEAFARGMGPVDHHAMEDLILGILRRSSREEIAAWMDVEEGLENRIKEFAHKAAGLDDFLSQVKTRRYVLTRLQRILVHGLLNLTKQAFREMNSETGPAYLRILAFSEKAAPLLKRLGMTARVPVLTKAAHVNKLDDKVRRMFAYDCLATDLYGLATGSQELRQGDRDYTQSVSIL